MSTISSPNTFADTLNGLFKQRYADKLKDLIPEGLKLYKMIEFLPKEKSLGDLYHQPVILGQEQGVTFASSTDDAFNLNAPIAGQIQDAQVRGNPIVLRSALGYAAASRSIASGAAFESATKYLVANMLRSITKKIEIVMFYGQTGLATVGSAAGNVITITTSEWAPGIWAGSEKMPLEIRDTTGATVRGTCNVVSVSLSAFTVTVDLLPAGVVATDVLWFKGSYGNEFAGVYKIITNQGTLFNISAANYALWSGNVYSAGSASLSLAKIERAIALAVGKGLDDDVDVFVSPNGWTDLLVEQAALRRYDGSYTSADVENGAKAIKFYDQNGMVSIQPSIYVKAGYAFVLDMKELVRVGSTDVTFERPGMPGKFFRELENSAGYELRLFTDMALFCAAPGKLVLINNVVNSA